MLAVGVSDQSVDLLCEIGTVVHHRHDDAFRPQLGIDLSFYFLDCIKKINEPFADRYCGWTGMITLSAAESAFRFSILREGKQSIRM